METTRNIYDLKQRTYQYALEIIRFLATLPKDYITQTIGKQLLRSATSIGANIVEGRSSGSRKDFANFYNHALKSANESTFWLGLLKDSGRAPNEAVRSHLDETTQLSKILASCLITARGKRS